ncbi:hypothetical protein [Rhodococcus sp. NCIMB 12038]|uniref:hypothetical protein n=1 Tax=Rhodococcus sp. NCIMB 12038 TaxID=933800 RepID=UPI000B3C9348|nr:hypothetical protein [Rhodococcus sp. NCIMB 12038]OUS97436.1 hypothetical protein CA951_03585 [Rhodococcus sp. NCIMB 12038]
MSAEEQITRPGDALRAVPAMEARVAALRPHTEQGPDYRRRVVDELDRARHMWEIESAGACLVTAEIAAGLRPESDYLDRHSPQVYSQSPGADVV